MFFFFNDTATTEIYTLSLHDALPICRRPDVAQRPLDQPHAGQAAFGVGPRRLQQADAPGDQVLRPGRLQPQTERRPTARRPRSEEHTSELQSRQYLVCRLLLEKNT